MDDELPNIHIETLLQNINSNLFKEKIEARIIHWIEEGTKLAGEVVEREWKVIEKIAKKLLKEELIEGDVIRQGLKSLQPPKASKSKISRRLRLQPPKASKSKISRRLRC